jgi:hypothetical protein
MTILDLVNATCLRVLIRLLTSYHGICISRCLRPRPRRRSHGHVVVFYP